MNEPLKGAEPAHVSPPAPAPPSAAAAAARAPSTPAAAQAAPPRLRQQGVRKGTNCHWAPDGWSSAGRTSGESTLPPGNLSSDIKQGAAAPSATNPPLPPLFHPPIGAPAKHSKRTYGLRMEPIKGLTGQGCRAAAGA